jgi:hypothetical protein
MTTTHHEPTLFPLPPTYRDNDPDTSQEAGEMIPAVRVTDRERALLAHRAHPDGLTDFELAELMGRQQTSAGKRRGELVAQGLICDSGRRRPAPSGAKAIVWVLA